MKKIIFFSTLSLLMFNLIIVIYLIKPDRTSIVDKNITTINITSKDTNISAYILDGELTYPIIALFHPLHGSKEYMLDRVKFLNNEGYTVLAIDFHAHGKSSGYYKTFGYIEKENVKSVYNYIKRNFPDKKIGVLGISLGGASILLSDKKFDSIIIEETYGQITAAIYNRVSMRLGGLANLITPFLTAQLKYLFGIDSQKLTPITHINKISSPMYIICGQKDQRTKLKESLDMYKQIKKKQFSKLWIVKGAKHEDLYELDRFTYRKNIIRFFESTLL